MEPLEREARHFKVLASTTMGSSKYQTKTAQFRERERERGLKRERERESSSYFIALAAQWNQTAAKRIIPNSNSA